ncbi:alpha/beta fold hydrolase [Streptomyces lavendulae]|uniref:alpha/beta fold hydrolase n=1 Tax=Streptomyces lavendulae TaxID=1914 RepID=UPI0033180514
MVSRSEVIHSSASWSCLCGHVIAGLVDRGQRVVAPDLIGFGRSDKPTEQTDHTFARHVAWMSHALFEGLNLRQVTLFGQDWGGMSGLRLLAEAPGRFSRPVLANTGLPTGDTAAPEHFLSWQRFAGTTPVCWSRPRQRSGVTPPARRPPGPRPARSRDRAFATTV